LFQRSKDVVVRNAVIGIEAVADRDENAFLTN
jgi:hypothetical protein